MKSRSIVSIFLATFALSIVALAKSPAENLSEKIPDSAIPNADQRSLLKHFATRVNEVEVRYDEKGNVVHLALSNKKPWVEQFAKGEVEEVRLMCFGFNLRKIGS
ncbi:MAG: hypothetical protein AAF585_21800 [Verrucomicrobiota bacterium]